MTSAIALFAISRRHGNTGAFMDRIAGFLGIPIDEAKWPTIVEYRSFDWTKSHATRSAPLGGAFWDAGAQVFINQGRNGRWKDLLTDAEKREYENLAVRRLGPDAARWLATGERLA